MTKSLIIRWVPVILWACLIYFFSSLPAIQATQTDIVDFIIKKSAHVTEYGIFYFLLARAIKGNKRFQYAFFIALTYAFLDETHQLFTPGRGGTIRDVILFDTAGLIVSWSLLRRRLK